MALIVLFCCFVCIHAHLKMGEPEIVELLESVAACRLLFLSFGMCRWSDWVFDSSEEKLQCMQQTANVLGRLVRNVYRWE